MVRRYILVRDQKIRKVTSDQWSNDKFRVLILKRKSYLGLKSCEREKREREGK